MRIFRFPAKVGKPVPRLRRQQVLATGHEEELIKFLLQVSRAALVIYQSFAFGFLDFPLH